MSKVNISDRLTLVDVNYSFWGGKTAFDANEYKLGSGGSLPPKNLVDGAEIRIFDPNELKVFKSHRTALSRIISDYGERFGGLQIVPDLHIDECFGRLDEKIEEIKVDIRRIGDRSYYEPARDSWANKPENADYRQAILKSSLPVEEVRKRFAVDYVSFKMAPVNDEQAEKLDGRFQGLTGQIVDSVVTEANAFWKRALASKDKAGRTTKMTLERLRKKVFGLSFLNPVLQEIVSLLDKSIALYGQQGAVEGENFTELLAAVLILCDKQKIKDYAAGTLVSAPVAVPSPNPVDAVTDEQVIQPTPKIEVPEPVIAVPEKVVGFGWL